MQYEFDRVSIRMVKDPPLLSDKPIRGPGDAIDLINEFLHDFDRELMIVVNLKNDGTPIRCMIRVPMRCLLNSIRTPPHWYLSIILWSTEQCMTG